MPYVGPAYFDSFARGQVMITILTIFAISFA